METSADTFFPPHCPNPRCRYHKPGKNLAPIIRKGHYFRQQMPQRIPRFHCKHCSVNFSAQTFSTSYWQKRGDLAGKIFLLCVGAMGNRQMARALGVSKSTIAHQITRLARHCLLFHTRMTEGSKTRGPIAFDGFETFELSQYFPFHHNLAVETETGFFLFHTDSPLRRKGRMTPEQKRRREELEEKLGRPDPKAVEKGVIHLLGTVLGKTSSETLLSDQHPAYRRALRRMGRTVDHQVTHSRKHRGRNNPLFEVNLLDLMLRHSTAAHRRETIAFCKRRQASAEKLTIFQVWRNCIKRRWENGPPVSSAMLKGLLGRLLEVGDILEQRLFRHHFSLPEVWDRYYERRVETPALGRNRPHELSYAY